MGKRFKIKPETFKKKQQQSRTFGDWKNEENHYTFSAYDSERIRQQNADVQTEREIVQDIIKDLKSKGIKIHKRN